MLLLICYIKCEGSQTLVAPSTSGQFRILHLQLLSSYKKEGPLSTITWLVVFLKFTFIDYLSMLTLILFYFNK